LSSHCPILSSRHSSGIFFLRFATNIERFETGFSSEKDEEHYVMDKNETIEIDLNTFQNSTLALTNSSYSS
jgi:hypothetical protein